MTIPSLTSSTTAVQLWNETASTTAGAFASSWELILLILGSLLALFMILGIIRAFLSAFHKM